MPRLKKHIRKLKAPSFKRLWNLLSQKLRKQQPYCSICGQTEHLNVHHILSKTQYKDYRLEEKNLIVVCCGCHTFRKHSCHKNAIWFADWLKKHRPEQYAWVIEHM